MKLIYCRDLVTDKVTQYVGLQNLTDALRLSYNGSRNAITTHMRKKSTTPYRGRYLISRDRIEIRTRQVVVPLRFCQYRARDVSKPPYTPRRTSIATDKLRELADYLGKTPGYMTKFLAEMQGSFDSTGCQTFYHDSKTKRMYRVVVLPPVPYNADVRWTIGFPN